MEVDGDPMDKAAADLFFQAVSACSERSAMLISGFLSHPFAAFIFAHLRLTLSGSPGRSRGYPRRPPQIRT